jgi:hypothetical protein
VETFRLFGFEFILHRCVPIRQNEIIDQQQLYVKPVDTVVTPFCTDLTGTRSALHANQTPRLSTVSGSGIRPEDVEDGCTLEEAIRQFESHVISLTDPSGTRAGISRPGASRAT